MSRKQRNLANYSSIIATIATAILAITALITVYITISAWKEEREANRPYFTFKESPKVEVKDFPQFEINFTNVGQHPAINLWSKSIALNTDLKTKPVAAEEFALVNDIPKNGSATLLIDLKALTAEAKEGKVPPYFFVIALQYKDPIINESFKQTLYIKWNGIENGLVLATDHAQVEEKQKIINYLAKERISF